MLTDPDRLAGQVKWNDQGLVPAIAQDWQSGEVLMLAWMNREALVLTLQEKRAIYWSRSRQALWRKGEESGHVQQLKELRIDCDADTVLCTRFNIVIVATRKIDHNSICRKFALANRI